MLMVVPATAVGSMLRVTLVSLMAPIHLMSLMTFMPLMGLSGFSPMTCLMPGMCQVALHQKPLSSALGEENPERKFLI